MELHIVLLLLRRWACVPDGDWPEEPAQRSVVISDFDLQTDFGDRRQEIVFIGAGMDEAAISERLDTALLDDDEMEKYAARFAEVRQPVFRGNQGSFLAVV